VTERVANELAPDASEEQERLRFAEDLLVELPALAPSLLVTHVGGELRHRRLMDVVDGYPERLERGDVVLRTTNDPKRIWGGTLIHRDPVLTWPLARWPSLDHPTRT
jgi:hypothetical protein